MDRSFDGPTGLANAPSNGSEGLRTEPRSRYHLPTLKL